MTLDNFRTIELIWDKANKSIIKTIKTASSDTTGRYLSVKILDGGQEVDLIGAKLQLYWEHPNFNTTGTDDFEVVNNFGLFKLTFSKEMLTNVGELNAHLVLTLSDGKITSDGFPIQVFKGADDGVVVPTNGDGLVKQVANKIDKGNVTLDDLTQEVKLAMTGGSVAVVGEESVDTFNLANQAVTPDKLSADLQSKITSNVKTGYPIEGTVTALPIGTTRFNNTPSLIGGDVTEIKINVAKAGTAKIKVIQKVTDTTFKTVSDQTVTLNRTGLVTLVSGTDYTPITIQKDEYIAWRGITAEIGYIAGGTAYYATAEGAIGAEQTYSSNALTLAIAWSVGKDGTILKDIAELKDAVFKPFEIADGSIEPRHTTFFKIGKNIFDKSKVIDGYYVNQVSGALQANSAHKASSPITVESGATYVSTQLLQRYALYNDETFISGGLNALTITIPSNANRLVVSSDGFDIDTLQIEKGTVATDYEPYGYKIKSEVLPATGVDETQFISDTGKKYRVVGANIRTPLAAGLPFELHNDAGHEPMGITSATIVGEGLRIGMPFTADKVISMNATPHVSMRNEGWEVATTGGLSVHEVHFYKNGVHVPASEVVLNGGSFWYSGVFLV